MREDDQPKKKLSWDEQAQKEELAPGIDSLRNSNMDYKQYQKQAWDSLATRHDNTHPLRAVISKDSDLTNYYFDKTTKRLLNRTIDLHPNWVILDLGCGIGRLSLWFASRAKKIIGVDISPEMINIAKGRATSCNLSNIEFLVIDGCILPFEDDYFDLIVCCGTLKYVMDNNDLAQIVREMCRVVKPNGYVAIIEQVDSRGPVTLHGKDDIAGEALLRPSDHYISLFRKCNVRLIGHYSLYHRWLFKRYDRLATKLRLGRPRRLSLVSKLVTGIDVWLDGLLKSNLKDKKGFHLLQFQKVL